jgi:hypothetical protein
LFSNGSDYQSANYRYTVANSGLPYEYITDYAATYSNVSKVFNGLAYGTDGFPKITNNDFFYVFTFGHGKADLNTGGVPHGYLQLQNNYWLIDDDFGTFVKANAAKRKVIWMENCAGGQFKSQFQYDPYVYFSSASQGLGASLAYPADNIFKLNSNYYPLPSTQLEKEIVNFKEYAHGEWIYHLYSDANGLSPTLSPYYAQPGNTYASQGVGDYVNFDYNGDGYKTYKELFDYAFLQTSSQQIPQQTDWPGISDYSCFEWPTLLHDQLNQNMSCRGLIGISNNTYIPNGKTLTIEDGSYVHFLPGSSLTVLSGGNLVIGSGVQFIKDNPNTTILTINGTLNSLDNVTFDGINGNNNPTNFIEIRLNTGLVNNTFTNCTFKQCALKGTGGIISLNNSVLIRSYCEYSGQSMPVIPDESMPLSNER